MRNQALTTDGTVHATIRHQGQQSKQDSLSDCSHVLPCLPSSSPRSLSVSLGRSKNRAWGLKSQWECLLINRPNASVKHQEVSRAMLVQQHTQLAATSWNWVAELQGLFLNVTLC